MTLTYQQTLDYINNFGDSYLRAIEENKTEQTWGLESTIKLLEQLDNPHLTYPVIHVAGTKGKGSTAAMLAQILTEAGLKTGLYTSPPLEDFRERIQIDRALIPQQALAALVEDIGPRAEKIGGISHFELITVLALAYFAANNADVAVVEVGLGGRFDATGVVQPAVCAITNISLDHTQLLGNTVAEIAMEKAGIIKAGVPVVSAPQERAAAEVIQKIANELDAPLTLLGRDWQYKLIETDLSGSTITAGPVNDQKTYKVGLPGTFQAENAAVALAVIEQVQKSGISVPGAAVAAGLRTTHWAGRMEVLQEKPLLILDSAHNPHSIARLVESLQQTVLSQATDTRSMTLIFGCMADKDIPRMLQLLLPVAEHIIFTQTDHPRAAEANILATNATNILDSLQSDAFQGKLPRIESIPDLATALQSAQRQLTPDNVLCITGSVALAGTARTLLLAAETGTQ